MLDDAWRGRLADAIKGSGRAMREVSLAAGMGPSYLHGVLKGGKDPTIYNLVKVCGIVGVSLSHVLYGYDMTAQEEDALRLLKAATPGEREALLQILRERHGS